MFHTRSLTLAATTFIASVAVAHGALAQDGFQGPPPKEPLEALKASATLDFDIDFGALSPSGKLFAAGGTLQGKPNVTVLSLEKATPKSAFPKTFPATAAAFHPEETVVAIARVGEGVTLYRLPDLTEIRTFKLPEGKQPVLALAYSPDGKHVAGATEFDVVQWDAESGEVAQRVRVDVQHGQGTDHDRRVIAYSPDGTLIATASWNHSVRVFAADKLTPRKTWTANGPVHSMAFSSDSRTLWIALARRPRGAHSSVDPRSHAHLNVVAWEISGGEKDLRDGKKRHVTAYGDKLSVDIAPHKSGDVIAIGGYGFANVIDIGLTHRRVFSVSDSLTDVYLSNDAGSLVTASQRTVRVWDIDSIIRLID